MSIYASLPGIEGARRYRGSHVVPSETDGATAEIGLALIPSHVTRNGRDDNPEDERPWPWLRIDIYGGNRGRQEAAVAAAVINPTQARDLARQLTEWADSAEPTEYEETQP